MAGKQGDLAKEFAVSVVQRLREAGFEALWAGGCVRDRLLGWQPKDYDVATDATPDEVCRIFGSRRTLRIGEAFGVVAILGRSPLEPIEVATFRRESGYSDGRHPDHVDFCSAKEDALRRDFTINGMFYDPIANRVIDYVQGQADLTAGTVRSIGDAEQRLTEDRLRMLRAIRFAASFDFQIDAETMEAIRRNAKHIVLVSAERIANEMRRMMAHPNAIKALRLLKESELREFVLPEFAGPAGGKIPRGETAVETESSAEPESAWETGVAIATHVRRPRFEAVCAALLLGLPESGTAAKRVGRRWKLSNAERDEIANIVATEATIRVAHQVKWPEIQRVLVQPFAAEAISVARAVCVVRGESMAGVEFCQSKIALPKDVLNPDPLITGDDLISVGIRPGPAFRTLLHAVRDRQLEGDISTAEEALRFALELSGKTGQEG